MSEQLITCELTGVTALDNEELKMSQKTEAMKEQPIFSVLSDGLKQQPSPAQAASPVATTSDTESGIFSGECETCVEHESELDWFCCSERKLICSHCAIVGSCHGHTVTPLATRVTTVRNQLVDVCEKIQLQALRIERFIDQTLNDKEQKLQAAASRAREQVVAQVTAAREALEEEEQRLLEEVHREEERVEQCLLTQRAHWKQALASLSNTRTRLVHTLTHTPDAQLVSNVMYCGRVEEAEGVGEPHDTDQLSMRPGCNDSKLLRGLWATAILQGPNAHGSMFLKFDQRTVSPLLALSDDHYTVTFVNKKANSSMPYDPARFDCWPNALGSLSLSCGTHCWVVDVGKSGAFKIGVCYASMHRKGSGVEARLGYNAESWVLSQYAGEYSFCHNGKKLPLPIVKHPQKIGVLLDWPSETLLFYELDSSAVLYSLTHRFSAPLLPAFAVTDRSITILH